MVVASGIPYTLLALCSYYENYEQLLVLDGRELKLSLPCPRFDDAGNLMLSIPVTFPEQEHALVSLEDVGAAVATVLANPAAHAGKRYGLISQSACLIAIVVPDCQCTVCCLCQYVV